MCELLGMSASDRADLATSLSLLRPRGGAFHPHADGWGVALYDGKAARLYKEPDAASRNSCFPLLYGRQAASHTLLAHQRSADPPEGRRNLSDTQPFERELGGRSWVFAHDGALPGIGIEPLVGFHPIGGTDSEHAFCLLLDTARDYLTTGGDIGDVGLMLDRLARKVSTINEYGEFNFLLSDGEHLFVHAHSWLHSMERHRRVEGEEQSAFLFTTHPPTDDEPWACLLPNTLSVFRRGCLLARRTTLIRAPRHAWVRQQRIADELRNKLQEADRQQRRYHTEIGDGHLFESG